MSTSGNDETPPAKNSPLIQEDQTEIVTILIGGSSFPANKSVLSRHSSFFEAAFSAPMKEKDENSVEIKENLSTSAFEQALSFMSTGKIDLSASNLEDIFRLAEFLSMDAILSECSKFILTDVSLDNFVSRWTCLDELAKDETKEKLCLQLADKFAEVYFLPGMLQLNLKHALGVLKCLDVEKRAKEIFTFAVNWLKYDMEIRKSQFKNLLPYMNLSALPKAFTAQILEHESFFPDLPEAFDEVRNTLTPGHPRINLFSIDVDKTFQMSRYNINYEWWNSVITLQPLPITSTSDIRHVFSNAENIYFLLTGEIYIFNAETNLLQSTIALPNHCSKEARGTFHSDYIYIADSNYLSAFNMTDKSWSKLDSLPRLRCNERVEDVTVFKGNLLLVCSKPPRIHYWGLEEKKWKLKTLSDRMDVVYNSGNTLYLMNSTNYRLFWFQDQDFPFGKMNNVNLSRQEDYNDVLCFYISPEPLCYVIDVSGQTMRKFACDKDDHRCLESCTNDFYPDFMSGMHPFGVVNLIHGEYSSLLPNLLSILH